MLKNNNMKNRSKYQHEYYIKLALEKKALNASVSEIEVNNSNILKYKPIVYKETKIINFIKQIK